MSELKAPSPDLQLTFHTALATLRETLLLDALLATVAQIDIKRLDDELAQYAPSGDLRRVAAWGLRGEITFPTPCILEKNPRLLGYYRLLLGVSKKQFYGRDHGLQGFASMEEKGRVTPRQLELLDQLCRCLGDSASALIQGVDRLSRDDVHDLTLLTLGPQLRGGALNVYGATAIRRVFRVIREIVASGIVSTSERRFEIMNAAGRTVRIEFSSDPDISVRELLSSGNDNKQLAIEVKGGKDVSNIHNRLGEAEKSHQKAKGEGFLEFWTVVGVSRLDLGLASKESPTTNRFYSLDAIEDPEGHQYTEFRESLRSRIGISD